MTDTEAERPPRLREKTVFLLACGGILLLLGLILGVVVSKRNAVAPDDVQVGGTQGSEQGLIIEGVAPRVIPKDTEFVVRARVTNVGYDTLRDIQLTIGAQTLIMPVPEGTTPSMQIATLPAGESAELIATMKAIEPGRTSIAAHAKDGTKRVATGRYWDVEVSDQAVPKPDYMPGALMALRVSTFGPTTVDPTRPFEIMAVVENSGQVVLEKLRLVIRAGDGLRTLHSEALDYDVEQLAPNGAQSVRARFKMDKPLARAQIHVYVHDAAGWVAGVGTHTVSSNR